MSKNKWRLLLIDDDEIYNLIMLKMVKESGHPVTCTTALDGKKAMRKIRRWHVKDQIQYPDIILLDLEMPVMNGFEFLDIYEEEFYPLYPNTQIYMVSASIKSEDRIRAKEYASVSNFISKPFPLTALETIINQSLLRVSK